MKFALVLFLLLPATAWGEGPVLLPPTVPGGGVALVQWIGAPPSGATVLFRGEEVSLSPSSGGSVLVGVDLDLPPGRYPVTVRSEALPGGARVLELQVVPFARPEQRLTLPPAMVTPQEPAVLERIAAESALLSSLYAGRTERLWEEFSRPVNDPVGSVFGLRRILNGEPRAPHNGVDFRSPRGTPVIASGRGRVVFSGELYFAGRTVILDHGEGLFTVYAHLEEARCSEGEILDAGAVLGRVGSTGRSTGPHLHWGVRLRGDRVDPLALLELFSR